MTDLYPLTFEPIFKEKIWGGQKMQSVLNKDTGDLKNCGESWEVSGVSGNISKVSNGELKGSLLTDLIKKYQEHLVGKRVYDHFGNEFPLLIKFIDASEDLSIQVHPNDQLAMERHNSFGKTEMWYVLNADPGAKLISGFNRSIDKNTYLEYFNSGRLEDILNYEDVKTGDVFYVPAGRVHTIGKGLLITEIQQTSDVTYRIYDFERTDADGNKRELHVEQAIDALDYNYYNDYKTSYSVEKGVLNTLVHSPYFHTDLIQNDQDLHRNYESKGSFVIIICLEGKILIESNFGSLMIKSGEASLIPACINNVDFLADEHYRILEVSVP